MELSIFSQDHLILGSFDIIEIDPKNPNQIIGWSCHLKDMMRVLGKYSSAKIAIEVLDRISARENALRSQYMKSNVFEMPDFEGR